MAPSVAGASQSSALASNPQSAPKKGTGAWGLSVDDSVYTENGSNPTACSGPPSACNAYLEQRSPLEDALSTSSAFGSASLVSTTALGSLSGSAKAASTGLGSPSSSAQPYLGFEDTFTITSKTLKPGTPVSLTVTLKATGKPFHCTPPTGYASFATGTLYSGLSFSLACTSSPPPVLTATLNTQVGATFTDGLGFYLSVSAGSSYQAGAMHAGPFKAVYHLDPITAGASYKTASGHSYL